MSRNHFRNYNQRGFTLIDLVVSAVILIIILSFVLANFRGAGQNDLNLALQKFVSDIREVQIMGLAGKIFNSMEPPTYPDGGYGIRIDQCSAPPCLYQVFADLNSNIYPDDEGLEKAPADFARSLLGKNFVERICFARSNPPTLPPFNANGYCQNDWQEVNSNFFVAVFQADKVLFRTIQLPELPPTDIKYIGVLLKNQKFSRRAYLYISKETGLVSSGLLK